MDHHKRREIFILTTMATGLARAAHSFSGLVGTSVRVNNTIPITLKHAEDSLFLQHQTGEVYLLITQLIGDVIGRSYFIVNEIEAKEILQSLGEKVPGMSESMTESLLLEIDNIISASVIAELSNALKVEVYGDVPQIKKIKANELSRLIADSEMRDDANMLVMNTSFRIGQHDGVHPQFIWKLTPKIFEVIPVEKISA
jgi:chemotaxis protein CheY-P-specific phosphatase CheC